MNNIVDNETDSSVILSNKLDEHTMKKYEFKTIEQSEIVQKNDEILMSDEPSPSQVSMIQSSIEKELIEKLLNKSDDLSNSLNNFQMQFEKLQEQSNEREKVAREEGFKEGEMKAKLSFSDELEKEKEKIAKSIIGLNDTIESVKSQIIKLESELSAIALDIAKEVIIKEINENSAKVAAAISKELLSSMGGNLNVLIKVNPLDFEYISEQVKGKENIKVKSDEAIAKGGVVIIGDNGNIDGNVMSRYQLLKQSVLENFRG